MKQGDNRESHSANIESCNVSEDTSCLEEEQMDVPEILEDIIELLLSGLRDTVCLEDEIQLL